MKTDRLTYIKNILIPCLLFSAITGIVTGALIFLFKFAASAVAQCSAHIYHAVNANPSYLPLLLIGACAAGGIAAFILKSAPACRGGGIPTSIVLLRGLIDFHWLKSIFVLFASAMLTYLGGIPLGNEGPSVQIGTAVGRGTVDLLAHNNRAWDRYVMTGGACAGFAAATGAPIAGIFFAFEEAHRRFSPMIFMVASMTVIASNITMELLCELFQTQNTMFDFTVNVTLPLRLLWSALAVGAICGLLAVLFTKVYRTIQVFFNNKLNRVPFTVKVMLIFVSVALIGFFSTECIGSGHDLIEALIHGHQSRYLLLIFLCVRAILLIVANITGITGGLFIPTLTFGAMIGALSAHAMISLGILPEQYHIVMVIIGMASFLAASSRIPITAITFAVEALSGLTNILPIIGGVTISYLVIETIGITSFTDTVIEGKLEQAHRGKEAKIVDTHLTVTEGAFAIGKEIRDILWPPTCVIMSIRKNGITIPTGGIGVGDVLHVHYQTYEPEQTMHVLEAIVGKQECTKTEHIHTSNENHQVPDL